MAHFSYSQSTFFLFLIVSLAIIEVSMLDYSSGCETFCDLMNESSETTHVTFYAGEEGSLTIKDCPTECARRCSQTHHRKPCLFFCNKCCAKCLCVPSGFYGHKEECSCYNNWKTKEGAPKCP